jgi:hypothetical protein
MLKPKQLCPDDVEVALRFVISLAHLIKKGASPLDGLLER